MLKRRPGLFERADKIIDGLGLPDRLCRKMHMKSSFDAQDQFGAGEAVNSEIALDAAGRLHITKSTALRMKLADKVAYEHDQVLTVQLDVAWCKIAHNSA